MVLLSLGWPHAGASVTAVPSQGYGAHAFRRADDGGREYRQSNSTERGAAASSPAWLSAPVAAFPTEHLVQMAQSGQPAPGQDKPLEEPPPLPGYKRYFDFTVLQCIDGYWHEITYAFYASRAAGGPTGDIYVKIGDKDTGERCFVPPPERDGRGRVPVGTTTRRLLECINGYWYEVTYVEYNVENPRNPFENPRNPFKNKYVLVKFAETTTGKPCSVTTPKPNPPPEPSGPGGTTALPGGGTTPGTTPAPPCPGAVLGSSRARSECNPDGFWHVVSDEEWICPDGTRKQVMGRDIEKTKQPCKPGQPIPPGLPGSVMTPQPPGPGTAQGGSGQTPGPKLAPSGPGTTSGPSAEDLRRMRQSLERESGSGGIYVPLPPHEQQTPSMPVPLPQPRRMPTAPGETTPTPTQTGSPVPKAPATATPAPVPSTGAVPPTSVPSTASVMPAPTGFPGRWRGNNGCGIGSLTIVSNGGKLVAQGMPGNGSVPLAADGPTATAQGVVLFGQPNHRVVLFQQGPQQMHLQGQSPKGDVCNEPMVRQ